VAVSAAAQYRKNSGDNRPMIVASTASPYKFAADVYTSLTGEKAESDLAALDLLSAKTGTEITYPLKGIGTRTVRFEDVVDADKMADAMFAYLKA
jgi:threonine synthase